MGEQHEIKARQVRRALVRIGARLEEPWPGTTDLQKYALFLKQAAEALEGAPTEVDDDTILTYSAPPVVDPTVQATATPTIQPLGFNAGSGIPSHCDDSVNLYVDVW